MFCCRSIAPAPYEVFSSVPISMLRIPFLCTVIIAFVRSQQIPQHLLNELASISDINQVFRRYGAPLNGPEPEVQPMTICVGPVDKCKKTSSSRMASGPWMSNSELKPQVSYLQAAPTTQESGPPLALNAGCSPTETVIEMPKTDSSVVVYPPGTKVKRCSGVCGHSNLLCKPTKTTKLIRKGLVLKYENGNLVPVEYQNFSLEEHTACSCDCLEKPADCLSLIQTYDSNNCKCTCKNQSMANSCGLHQMWDAKECRCKCPSHCGTRSCPFGMVFDDSYCSCIGAMASRSAKPRKTF
ncbi:hypothetical protein RvY_15409 [Ramazzottius varieornatus]|uniref:Platelet-derived growth factor (PDGF) family profile domain-containing protein n=1 Tax=Ramazzottius varieornatus TaxID=947166 RepID=A0A1D1VWE6_RAMVA|nr:hypothetical protein RvY_15409 [Ramazzottius varieornatus]